MKKILLIVLLTFFKIGYSQDFEKLYKKVSNFESQEEYDNVDSDIQNAVDYLLNRPYKEETKKYYYAHKSLITWMDGTSNYRIIIGGKLMDIIDEKSYLKNIYMASMTKYLLNEHLNNNRYVHPEKQEGIKFIDLPEVQEILFKGGEIFMEYLDKNDMSLLNKNLKKALKQYKKGELRSFMFE
ncbi:hypothetical protein SAMN04488009_3599 [Maribacter sedimenticola]|uniref:Uncharacterized protein n=1 Tax=Maribacter sedimenticola TaxID=228956 RepID=A0ABY1SLW8_9FLAO|nr:hypothetical protein [Maribacter sedimenticola]SNR75258.1 hypothetical protein SAMN04488009_3599 [Maribacter sedimenticola]